MFLRNCGFWAVRELVFRFGRFPCAFSRRQWFFGVLSSFFVRDILVRSALGHLRRNGVPAVVFLQRFLVCVILGISVLRILRNMLRIDVLPLAVSRAHETCLSFWIWRPGFDVPCCACLAFLCSVAVVRRLCCLSRRFRCSHMCIFAFRRESGLLMLSICDHILVFWHVVSGGLFFFLFVLYRVEGVSAVVVFAMLLLLLVVDLSLSLRRPGVGVLVLVFLSDYFLSKVFW